ncbi:GspE/PulE family protein, partial [Rhodocaloribacter sp.]
ILRHDPDVVMVGEMRDRATAELAIKLANTGHLTFSTLHTNDAPSAVSRLYKMGVEPFLIAYAINLVVAQRLMRTLCPECKIPHENPDPVLMTRLGFTEEELAETTLYRSGSNEQCGTCFGVGYKGRRAIAEVLPFSPEIRHIIVAAKEMIDEAAIRRQGIEEGMITQQEAARALVREGITSVEEMMRVVFTSQ